MRYKRDSSDTITIVLSVGGLFSGALITQVETVSCGKCDDLLVFFK